MSGPFSSVADRGTPWLQMSNWILYFKVVILLVHLQWMDLFQIWRPILVVVAARLFQTEEYFAISTESFPRLEKATDAAIGTLALLSEPLVPHTLGG